MLSPAKPVSKENIQYLLKLSDHHIGNIELVKMFNHYYDKTTKKYHEPMFNPYDIFTVHKGDLKCIHTDAETTVGLFLLNKYLIDGTGLHEHISYINHPMNAKDLGQLNNRVASLYSRDKITVDIVNKYLTVRDIFLSMVYQIILPSLSENIMRVQPAIEKRADELLEKYKVQIEAGDLVTMNKIQDELVNYARDLLQDDESMILYLSGSKPVFSNNYKVLSIMRGPVRNETTGKYEFITTSLVGGITKQDIPSAANTILASEYPTAIATAASGYQSKKILYVMQGETLGEKGSDCGSKATKPMVATKSLAEEYRYFVQGDKIIQLNPSNITQYEGKVLNFRTPMACTRDHGPCNICAGDYPYMLGIHNIGLLANRISGSLLNSKTKQKHDLSYKTSRLVIRD